MTPTQKGYLSMLNDELMETHFKYGKDAVLVIAAAHRRSLFEILAESETVLVTTSPGYELFQIALKAFLRGENMLDALVEKTEEPGLQRDIQAAVYSDAFTGWSRDDIQAAANLLRIDRLYERKQELYSQICAVNNEIVQLKQRSV